MSATRNEIISEFRSTTTAHGVNRLNTDSHIRKTVWTIFLVATFAGFAYHLSTLVTRYLTYPANTEIVEGGTAFVFPDITLCPTAFFATTGWFQRVPDDRNLHGEDYSNIRKRVAKLWKLVINATSENNNAVNAEALASMRSVLFVRDNSTAFKDTPDHILFCRYRGEACSFLNFTVYKHPTSFRCFTFKPQDRSLVSAGPSSGLELILFAGQAVKISSVAEQLEYIRGYEVSVHSPHTRPDFITREFKAQTGFETAVELQVTGIQQLNRPNSPCLETAKRFPFANINDNLDPDVAYYRYSFSDCHLLKWQEQFIKECGCYDDKNDLPLSLLQASKYNLRGCHALDAYHIFKRKYPGTHLHSNHAYTNSESFFSTFQWTSA